MSDDETRKLKWDGRQDSVKDVMTNLRLFAEHRRDCQYANCLVDLSQIAALLCDQPHDPREIEIKRRLDDLTRRLSYRHYHRRDFLVEREIDLLHWKIVEYGRPTLMPTDSTAKRRVSITRFTET